MAMARPLPGQQIAKSTRRRGTNLGHQAKSWLFSSLLEKLVNVPKLVAGW